MDNKKICFIMCTNDELYEKECVGYINRLIVPEGYTIDILSVKDASSMTSGYNEAMRSTDAKYKVYLHQDVFIVDTYFIYEILHLFDNREIGMIGAVGSVKMPESCVMWYGDRVGALYSSNIFDSGKSIIGKVDGEYQEVEAIDGLIMVTQYDIQWREDLFKDWDFYDISQSQEFIRLGYKVIVPNQERIWCIHDDGFLNLEKYNKNRLIYINEYKKKEQQKVDDKKVAFIICTNSDMYMNECEYYINRLIVPEGMSIEIIKIKDASSMASGYNNAMKKTNAKYKIYLHHDVFLVYENLISDMLEIFSDEQIGMIGVIGGRNLKNTGECSEYWDTGCTMLSNSINTFIMDLNEETKETRQVLAIDGMLMITQYDIRWSEEVFDGWHFYDISQSMNFAMCGYKVVVPDQKKPWAFHDEGYCDLEKYDYYRKLFCEQYSQFGFQYMEHENRIPKETYQLFKKETENLMTEIDTLSIKDCIAKMVKISEYKVADTKVSYILNVLEIITKEVENKGYSQFTQGLTFQEMCEEYLKLKFLLMRISMHDDKEAMDTIIKLLQSNKVTMIALKVIINHSIIYKNVLINKINRENEG